VSNAFASTVQCAASGEAVPALFVNHRAQHHPCLSPYLRRFTSYNMFFACHRRCGCLRLLRCEGLLLVVLATSLWNTRHTQAFAVFTVCRCSLVTRADSNYHAENHGRRDWETQRLKLPLSRTLSAVPSLSPAASPSQIALSPVYIRRPGEPSTGLNLCLCPYCYDSPKHERVSPLSLSLRTISCSATRRVTPISTPACAGRKVSLIAFNTAKAHAATPGRPYSQR